MEKENIPTGYEAVKKLAEDYPDWLPIVEAALDLSKTYKSGEIAGRWVLNKAREKNLTWLAPTHNLRKLVSYGILEKVDTSRGGRRAYYIMPDPEGVERALKELK